VNNSCDLHTRNICPRDGIEDPACGVGNGALPAYISQFCWTTKTDFSLKIEQGTIVHMPSLIHTRTIRTKETMDVFFGGAGVIMLEGHFLV
jgi:trans-2,3-dihydro-3-hydroxyanthranilate isomerase